MTTHPRRLPPTNEERVRNAVRRYTPGSAAGGTRFAHPVLPNGKGTSSGTRTQGSRSPRDMQRLALVTGFSSGDYGDMTFPDAKVPLNALPSGANWGVDEDTAQGDLSYDNNGNIFLPSDGLWSVTLILNVAGIQDADPACSIRFFADIDEPFSTGFSVMARGGDARESHADLPCASLTYWRPAGTIVSVAFMYRAFDTSNVTDVGGLVQVQALALD